jgi:hypothetical protein
MIFSDLASPAEASFAKAGNRFPLFGIMLRRGRAPDADGNDAALSVQPLSPRGLRRTRIAKA